MIVLLIGKTLKMRLFEHTRKAPKNNVISPAARRGKHKFTKRYGQRHYGGENIVLKKSHKAWIF